MERSNNTKTLILLHLAVFLAGWTGIFGLLCAFAAVLFGELQEVNWSFWLGISLIIVSVLIQTVRVRNRRPSTE